MDYTRADIEQAIQQAAQERFVERSANLAGTAILNKATIVAKDAQGQRISYDNLNIHHLRAHGSRWDGLTLGSMHAEYAFLTEASFVGSRLFRSAFDDALLHSANFTDAVLHTVSLQRARAARANFTHTDLTKTNMAAMYAPYALFHRAYNTVSVSLKLATLDDARFTEAVLLCADFEGASLQRANFTGATLTGCSFNHCLMDRDTLKGATLSRTTTEHIRYIEEKGNDKE
jgi:uncharacterized protein YjbI with pentapeptide repeats